MEGRGTDGGVGHDLVRLFGQDVADEHVVPLAWSHSYTCQPDEREKRGQKREVD